VLRVLGALVAKELLAVSMYNKLVTVHRITYKSIYVNLTINLENFG
jgi:hypothetical protein